MMQAKQVITEPLAAAKGMTWHIIREGIGVKVE
jgi:hypothetical protein